jgi:hypothetical protein
VSELLEPGAVYRALLEVQDGGDPAEVYASLMEGAIDPEEAVMEMFMDDVEADHDFEECRDKFARGSFCHGSTCVYTGNFRMQVDCPCECHKDEEPS